MVGNWFHDAANFAVTWLPLAFFLMLVLLAWLLWRTVGMMPRTKPVNLAEKSRVQTTWADVAGVEEVRAELLEVVEFLSDPQRFERLGAKTPKGLLLYGRPGSAGQRDLQGRIGHARLLPFIRQPSAEIESADQAQQC